MFAGVLTGSHQVSGGVEPSEERCVWRDGRLLLLPDTMPHGAGQVSAAGHAGNGHQGAAGGRHGATENVSDGGMVTGVAQLVERRTRDPKTQGSNSACVRSTRKNCQSFFESKMLC